MNVRILYEDNELLLVHKPAGFPTQTSRLGQQDVVSEIRNYLTTENGNKPAYVGLINRLDQPVEGIVLLAKNEVAAKELSRQLQKDEIEKIYYAIICGKPVNDEGTLIHYLQKDAKTNLSRVVPVKNEKQIPKNVKRAELSYELVSTKEDKFGADTENSCIISLLRIRLKTGRHHQIRVQMAHEGMPLLGDTKYGNAESKELSLKLNQKNVALCAYKLSFSHPRTKKKMYMEIETSLKNLL